MFPFQYSTKAAQKTDPSDNGEPTSRQQTHHRTVHKSDVRTESNSEIHQTSNAASSLVREQEVSLFFQESGQILHIRSRKHLKDISIYLPQSEELMRLCSLPEKDKALRLDETSPAATLDSIDERAWKEQKLDRTKLFQHYLMLSKIRLTGDHSFVFDCLIMRQHSIYSRILHFHVCACPEFLSA